MEEEFKGKALDAINKFRVKPVSYKDKLEKFLIFVERFSRSKKSAKDSVSLMEEFIEELPSIQRMTKFSLIPELCTIAENELKKYRADKMKYKQFQTGKTLNGVIGDGLAENSCALIANESSSPEDMPNQVLLEGDDFERVGYQAMLNNNFVELGIASKYDEQEEMYDYVLLFSIPGALSDQLDTDIDLTELKEAFDLFDYKKRGLINTHSIEQMLRNLGWPEDEDGTYSIMKELDEKKGKKVNFNTFAKFILEHITVKTDDDDYIRRVFNLYRDDVKNDTVTLYTMREVAKDLECPKCLEYLNQVYGNAEGKDIILTFEEFRDFMHQKYPSEDFNNKKTTVTTKKTVVKKTVKH